MAMVNCGMQMILGFVMGLGVFAVMIGFKKIRIRKVVTEIKNEEKQKQQVIEKAENEIIKARKPRNKKLIDMECESHEILDNQNDGQSTTETYNEER